jgi:SRSO17 transposase
MQAASRENMVRVAVVVPNAKSHNLQQFITHSNWSYRNVIDRVAQDVDHLLDGSRAAGYLMDESRFAKQGRGTVGVSWQWLG